MYKRAVNTLYSSCVVPRTAFRGCGLMGGYRNISMATAVTATTAWDRSPAEFDFRSDTLTTPTRSMLAALEQVKLADDVYDECTTTQSLESRIAQLLNKPDALFVLSGTMGNQLSLRAHLHQPPHSILLDAHSHIQNYEAGGVASLSQALTVPVHPANGKYITLDEVKKNVVSTKDVHFAPTRVISLENTINGVIMPLEEVAKIGTFARAHGIKVHLDGARLWNACSVLGAPALSEYAEHVDSVSVCFSKSLGAPVGSCIAADTETIARAKHMRKAVGGGIRQASVLTAMARVAVEEVFLKGRLREANAYAEVLGEKWTGLGGRLALPVDTNMLWLDLKGRGIDEGSWEAAAREGGVKIRGDRIVCHYQNSPEAIERVAKVIEVACKVADEKRANGQEAEHGSGNGEGKVEERKYGQSN